MSAWNTCVELTFVMADVADVVAAGHEECRVVDNETWKTKIPVREGEHPEPDKSTPLILYPAQSSSNRQRLGT